MVNIPPRTRMAGPIVTQSQTPAQAGPTAEQRIKVLEDQVAALMGLISFNGNHVEIKNTTGRIDIKATKIDLSGGGLTGVTANNKRVASKGDHASGTTATGVRTVISTIL